MSRKQQKGARFRKRRKPTRSRARSCRGKRRYVHPAAALRDAKRLMTENGHHFSVYRCEFCGAYHVGHTPWWAQRGDYL